MRYCWSASHACCKLCPPLAAPSIHQLNKLRTLACLPIPCLQRFVVRHSCGHIIPSSKAVVHRIRDFLLHVQQQERQQMEQVEQAGEDAGGGQPSIQADCASF